MGYPGGFGNLGWRGYGNPFQTGAPSAPGSFSYPPFQPYSPPRPVTGMSPEQAQPQKAGFLQGFAQAAQSAVQALQTAQGLGILAGLYAAKLFLGPGFATVMLLGAAGDGLFKWVNGLFHRNGAESGQGFFSLLVPAALLAMGGGFGFSLPAHSCKLLGKTYQLVAKNGETLHVGHRVKAAFGRCHYQGPKGERLNAYQLHWVRLKDWGQRLKLTASKSV